MLVYVDEATVLDKLDDDDLLDEVKARGLNIPGKHEPTEMEMVEAAYDALARGDAREALHILDQLLHPKWSTVKACESAYARHAQS